MKPLKPKDVALLLQIKPYQVTALAKDIEHAGLYRFKKTPIGSFLFKEEEIELLKEYYQTYYFFRKKKVALDMLRMRADLFETEEEKKPSWVKFLRVKV